MLLASRSRSKTRTSFWTNTATWTTVSANASGPSRPNTGTVATIANPSAVGSDRKRVA